MTEEQQDNFKREQRGEFTIKQPYDNIFPDTLICKCGCDSFSVGSGSYLTVVKCKECGLETCVHDG